MKFKVGEIYKSNQSGAVYKYLGKAQGSGYLSFEIVSGGSVGALAEFTIEYVEACFELQVEQGEEKAPESTEPEEITLTITGSNYQELLDQATELKRLLDVHVTSSNTAQEALQTITETFGGAK